MKIPILICIDVEPDARAIDPVARVDWKGFEGVYEFFGRLRPELSRATKSAARLNWFFRMDPQIAHAYGTAAWVVERYPEAVKDLRSSGDELGLHVHPWRWDEGSRSWVLDFDQTWIDNCVRLGFESFRRALGRPCVSFRFGERWLNAETLNLVETLGARFDLTIEPGLGAQAPEAPRVGPAPIFANAPTRPYHPSRADFRRPAVQNKRSLWAIPLSTGSTDWVSSPLASRRPVKSPANGAQAEAAYQGYHDATDCKWVRGWVRDASRPEAPLDVEIYADDVLLATVTANLYRDDLLKAGLGGHAFKFPVPAVLRDGRKHSIRVKVAGDGFELAETPREIECEGATAPPDDFDMAMHLSQEPVHFATAFDRLLRDSENPYLALVARSSVGSVAEERANLARNFEFILGHPAAESFVFETPPQFIKRLRPKGLLGRLLFRNDKFLRRKTEGGRSRARP